MKKETPLVAIHELFFQYPNADKWILDNVHFSLHPGERVGIMGDNGSGKSTIAKLILGIERPTKGKVCYRGRPVRWNKHYPAIGYIGDPGHSEEMQGLPNQLTVGQVVQIFQLMAESSGLLPHAQELHDLLRISDLLDKYTHRLSTGERKRVMTYLALSKPSELLILDEPFDGLDRETKEALLDRLPGFLLPETAVLYIAHNRMEIDLFTHLVFALREGSLSRIPQPTFSVSTRLNGHPIARRRAKVGEVQYDLIKLLDAGPSETIQLEIQPATDE